MPNPTNTKNWHIFCKVVDNYGDIGVSWRLAKQLVSNHQQQVTLWVDDHISFSHICPNVHTQASHQQVQGITVRHWAEPFVFAATDPIGDVVIEAFACELPATYLHAMQNQHNSSAGKPRWVNLEYLSAEPWVESCHLSTSPIKGMRKTFFFPGFSAATGGLMFDNPLITLPQHMAAGHAQNSFIQHLCSQGYMATPPPTAVWHITLFGYQGAPVATFLNKLAQACSQPLGHSVQLWVLGGQLNPAISQWLGQPLANHHAVVHSQLHLTVLPFLSQEEHDQLLAMSHLNIVRGEESFVRAQMLGKPMLWQIYPQDDNAHHAKLNAFLDKYTEGAPKHLQEQIRQWHHYWNQLGNPCTPAPRGLFEGMTQWQQHATIWQQKLLNNGDLTANLVKFCSGFV